MSDTRRELLVQLSATVTLAAVADAQHVHQAISQQKGPYKPKALTAHEYATLRRLADLIIPGALEAGAADFIDFLCAASDEMKDIYTGGLAWIDRQFPGKTFLEAQPAEQTAFLDRIAYRKNESPALNPGIQFFIWVRRMVADAYYTSPTGMKELGYRGNSAMSEFRVPQEAVDYALKHSPLG